MYSSDLEQMRNVARKKLLEKRRRQLRRHAWYHEMLRVATCNGLRQRITDCERRLIDQVRVLIGDVGDVERTEFPGLLREIPGAEFQREEVQRLIKFLKTSLQVSELEYLDALEESGHMAATTVMTPAALASLALPAVPSAVSANHGSGSAVDLASASGSVAMAGGPGAGSFTGSNNKTGGGGSAATGAGAGAGAAVSS